MVRNLVAVFVGVLVLASVPVDAQTGEGSLRGFIKDEQGGVLPGVTVTATSPQVLAPVVAVADSAGYYRLNNLPPGTYMVVAELQGFSKYQRDGIVMRAGSTFTVDIEMKVGTLSETVNVTGESPMLETQKPTSTLTIQGDLIREAPITSRRLFSDVLDMAPGVASRNVNDGVGRRAYYFHGAVLFGHVIMLEGAPASSYTDASAHSMGMGGDTIADTELRLGGVEANSPMGTGVVMNIIAPQGGNQFKGSVNYQAQPTAWNSDNTIGGNNPGGIPTIQSVQQVDGSVGGPVVRNDTWFFTAFRYANLTNGISRTPQNIADLTTFQSGFTPFPNIVSSKQPFVKVTTQLSQNQQLSGLYQRDRLVYTTNRELDGTRFSPTSTGGGLFQAKLSSVWSNSLTTQISVAYNNKGGADASTYAGLQVSGPQLYVAKDAFPSAGTMQGTGTMVQLNSPQSQPISPASMLVIRGDVTYFKEGWGGSHELKAGVWAEPRAIFNQTSNFVNGGFDLEEDREIVPGTPSAGLTAFHKQYQTPPNIPSTSERDRDIAVYVQDSWHPHARLSIDAGLRVDAVNRFNEIINYTTQSSKEVQPRIGLAYLVTTDAHNVLRASYGRLSEQMNGRDYIVSFGAPSTTGGGNVTLTNVYIDKTGKQTTTVSPAITSLSGSTLYAPNLHQPWVNEFVVGFRHQFPGQISADVAATRRAYHDNWGKVDVNGIYPSGPGLPFLGFGRVDPNFGIIYQEQNNTWSQTVVTAYEATVAKNMSHNYQLVASFTRQYQHLTGTWNPTDPARFIQPNAFADDKDLSQQLFGNGESNSLTSGGQESGAAYRPYALRMAGQWAAPWSLNVGVSYVIQAGGYLGTPKSKVAAPDPTYGPATFTLANGTTQSNPLATVFRIACTTRGDCQPINDTDRYLQLHVGRIFKIRGSQDFEPAINVFNLFNTGAYQQWNTGANDVYATTYLSVFNRQPPRAFQLSFKYRF
jgi:hypothetical protein